MTVNIFALYVLGERVPTCVIAPKGASNFFLQRRSEPCVFLVIQDYCNIVHLEAAHEECAEMHYYCYYFKSISRRPFAVNERVTQSQGRKCVREEKKNKTSSSSVEDNKLSTRWMLGA